MSPLADGGYDVADYRAIDPVFGTLEDAEALIADALALGIRTIVDIVPNHVSDRASLVPGGAGRGPRLPGASALLVPPGSRRGRIGACPRRGARTSRATRGRAPSTRTASPASGTCTCSRRAARPELGPPGRASRARGHPPLLVRPRRGRVRIDSAALLVKDPRLPEVPERTGRREHPSEDRDELHAIYRSWRPSRTATPGRRILVGEVWLPDTQRFARYLRPDELHTAFNFDFLARPWDAPSCAQSIDATLAAHAPIGAPATWVLSNHDVTRPVTRLRPRGQLVRVPAKRRGVPTDLGLGRRRARAAALLVAALPGSLYIYQGDELGLDEVTDLP